jgi:hypothetical protein
MVIIKMWGCFAIQKIRHEFHKLTLMRKQIDIHHAAKQHCRARKNEEQIYDLRISNYNLKRSNWTQISVDKGVGKRINLLFL